ncbi:MAG: hypothetical protein WAM62_11605 [Pseudolabrys sp.]
MYLKKLALAALLVATATGYAGAADLPVKAMKAAPEAPFFFVNDNSISYHYEFTATNPGAGKTGKNVLSFTHFDVWAYGTNFFNIDWLKATSASTPAAPCGGPPGFTTGCAPYTEIYGFFRSTFGFNEIFGTKAFSMGPLTDVSLMVGADANTDNTFLESAKKSIEAGLTFSFMAPYHGFVNLTPTVYKEWQNDGYGAAAAFGYNPSMNVSFNTTWGFEWLYVQPLGFLPPSIPLTFKAFGTIHGAKGCGEICANAAGVGGGVQRAVEYYTQENLELDVGKMIGKRPGMLSTWVGYRYWYNKFGIDHTTLAAASQFSIESTWLLGVTMAF